MFSVRTQWILTKIVEIMDTQWKQGFVLLPRVEHNMFWSWTHFDITKFWRLQRHWNLRKIHYPFKFQASPCGDRIPWLEEHCLSARSSPRNSKSPPAVQKHVRSGLTLTLNRPLMSVTVNGCLSSEWPRPGTLMATGKWMNGVYISKLSAV